MEPDPEVQPSGMQVRFMGLPLWVWVLIVAIVAYLWFSHRKGGGLLGGTGTGGAVTYSGGGGTGTASTRIDKGAVQITVSQGDQDQPHPPMRKRKETVTVPDVRGMKYTQAAEKLKDTGLNAERTSPYVGVVKRESPHSGSKVPRNTYINLSGKPWPPEKKDNDKRGSEPKS